MSDSPSNSSSTAPAAASEGSLAIEADILVAESARDVLPASVEAQGIAILGEPGSEHSAALGRAEEGTLALADVLPGDATDLSPGVFLTFDMVGRDTVVSVETIGKELGAPAQFLTLEGVTGMTLQQLLNNDLIA